MMPIFAIDKRLLCSALTFALWFSGCTSKPPADVPATPAVREKALPEQAVPDMPATGKPALANRFDGPGHNYASAIQLAGASNLLAFSQKQQEWLWLNYRDWKKQGQAMREKDGVKYDEVTLVNKQGETRVIYFRMPGNRKP